MTQNTTRTPRAGGESHEVATVAARSDERLSSGQAARLLEVSPITVARMARDGRLDFEETPHGYRTFRRADIEMLRQERAAGTAA
jgi:hypothetical protein